MRRVAPQDLRPGSGHRSRRGFDDVRHSLRMTDQGQVGSTGELGDVGSGAVGHRALRHRGDDLVAAADEVPRRDVVPGRRGGRGVERRGGRGTLRRPELGGLLCRQVVGEVVDEHVLAQIEVGSAVGGLTVSNNALSGRCLSTESAPDSEPLVSPTSGAAASTYTSALTLVRPAAASVITAPP